MKGLLLQTNQCSSNASLINKPLETNQSTIIQPKCYVIKLDDLQPKRIYYDLLQQSINLTIKGQVSKWYMHNRPHCVAYILKLCDRFHLRENTFYSAVSYADRLIRNMTQLSRREYDLKIIGCFLLAAKYVENDAYELDISGVRSLDLAVIYDRKSVKGSEVACLKELGYELNEPTVYDLLISQMGCGVVFKDEVTDKGIVSKFFTHIKGLLKQVINSSWSINYKPEIISLGIIQLGRIYFDLSIKRMKEIKEKLDFLDEAEYNSCFKEMKDLVVYKHENTLTITYTKNNKKKAQAIKNTIKGLQASATINNSSTGIVMRSLPNSNKNQTMRESIKYQTQTKLSLTTLSTIKTQMKGSDTSCSTKQDSSNTLLQDDKKKLNKIRSISTKPGLRFNKKAMINLSFKCSLPMIKDRRSSKEMITFNRKDC